MKRCFKHLLAPGFLTLTLMTTVAVQAQYHHSYHEPARRYYERPERAVYVTYNRHVPYYNYYSPYGYNYYNPFVPYYPAVIPSIGVHVGVLPRGYSSIWLNADLYFFSNGLFYRKSDRDYEVVNAPIGAEVPSLPSRAKVVVIDGNKYFVLDDTYYRETIKDNGEIWYTVVGKKGVVSRETTTAPPVGNVVTSLPANCKVVELNNQRFYLAPDGTYYQEITEDNQVLYKIAGRSENK